MIINLIFLYLYLYPATTGDPSVPTLLSASTTDSAFSPIAVFWMRQDSGVGDGAMNSIQIKTNTADPFTHSPLG